MWNGYLATSGWGGSNFNLLHIWTEADFAVVQDVFGVEPIGFCSGWDDAAGAGSLGSAWGVKPCLDDEDAIRPLGLWRQPWLDTSGAGLYGNWWRHNITAAFDILSAYPASGDPFGDSWWSGSLRPSGPCGWQWAGSHIEFGIDVDSEWLDDWFGGDMTPEQAAQLQWLWDQWHSSPPGTPPDGKTLRDFFGDIYNAIGALSTPTVDVNALAAALASHPLTAALPDAQLEAIATHVLQHLSKDAAAG
jgi:hypothetical protein